MSAHLLPGEKAFLDLSDLTPGQRVNWVCGDRGGYGFQMRVPARVVRVGKKRVTIEAPLRSGGTVMRSVSPSSLERASGAEPGEGGRG